MKCEYNLHIIGENQAESLCFPSTIPFLPPMGFFIILNENLDGTITNIFWHDETKMLELWFEDIECSDDDFEEIVKQNLDYGYKLK